MKLLTVGNAKTSKGESLGYLTGILYLAPHTLSGFNVCPKASAGCASACLNTAGRGRFAKIQDARLNKTRKFLSDRESFIAQLKKDIEALIRKAKRENLKPAVRLNGTSDLSFFRFAPELMQDFKDVQFYDYTKRIEHCRALKKLQKKGYLKNYHLTFSASEDNHADMLESMLLGFNVAMVFRNDLPSFYHSRPVIDGDLHDLRFLDHKPSDGQGLIVGLLAKGDAKKDFSGFVRESVPSELDSPMGAPH